MYSAVMSLLAVRDLFIDSQWIGIKHEERDIFKFGGRLRRSRGEVNLDWKEFQRRDARQTGMDESNQFHR